MFVDPILPARVLRALPFITTVIYLLVAKFVLKQVAKSIMLGLRQGDLHGKDFGRSVETV